MAQVKAVIAFGVFAAMQHTMIWNACAQSALASELWAQAEPGPANAPSTAAPYLGLSYRGPVRAAPADMTVEEPLAAAPRVIAGAPPMASFGAATGSAGDLLSAAVMAAMATRPLFAEIYNDRLGAPIWLAGGGAAASRLVDALEGAYFHGLPPERYGAASLRARLEGVGGDPDSDAALELDLSQAFVRYAADMRAGMLAGRSVDKVHVNAAAVDPGVLLAGAAANPGLALSRLAPTSPEYVGLQRAFTWLLRQSAAGGYGPPLPEGLRLRPGDRSEHVDALRAKLEALGDIAPRVASSAQMVEAAYSPAAEPPLYDADLVRATALFQTRHGLAADGIVGPRTLAALNTPIETRIAQALVNLERMRWRGEAEGPRRILVNQAAFEMTLYDRGVPAYSARVVVGEADPERHQTPEFSDEMAYLVFNPTWTVPDGIAVREILPELRKDPSYLAKNNMTLMTGNGVPVDPATVNWAKTPEVGFPYRIRQEPGEDNALGRVKFMFPNRFNVYLHDTPAKSLFNRPSRAFSHGCVRVENPLDFAEVILRGEPTWRDGLMEELSAPGELRTVALSERIPIDLAYYTAWLDSSGRLNFRDDVYGRDAPVGQALRSAANGEGSPEF